MAVAVGGGKDAIAGVIFHCDQGGEYTGHRFRQASTAGSPSAGKQLDDCPSPERAPRQGHVRQRSDFDPAV